ncbi:glycoside hydrolase family protein [Lignipirellula cremea]|uniref:Glycosyl hydrolase family 32 N-terminal domain-containing protein n=1 Tax=Lignipirellula cremea TaxID=2528010 RepID=A0A518DZA4_9BACT|nr:hypothetical protein [Lignipirellula cremea]QDU97176.1 hypothetical protein Pla8534_50210 [Lignipirellula cremea]
MRACELGVGLAAAILAILPATCLQAETPQRVLRESRTLAADQAHQGVAVDGDHLYAITNRSVGKYDKQTGKQIAVWSAPADSPLKHLNSGVVDGGKLYCAHSNWPVSPLQNSIEIWDAEKLEHVDRHRFTESAGAVTWVDRRDNHWWVAFAFYGDARNVAQTRVVKYNDQWQEQGSWRLPEAVIARMAPASNSGGSWGPDGLLHLTGHDRAETYALRLPVDGKTLELVDTLAAPIAGQGIAWDHSDVGVLYGIRRSRKQIVAGRLSNSQEFEPLQQPVVWRRDPRNPILPPGEKGSFDASRCMNPWIVRADDTYRLYYGGGDNTGRHRICLATASIDNVGQWDRRGPLFETGAEGAFDYRWCVLPHAVQFGPEQWRLYYSGNAGRGVGLSSFPGLGAAVSTDGLHWKRGDSKPLIAPSGRPGDPDAIGIAGGSVLQVTLPDGEKEWRYYYTGCPTTGSPLPLNQQKTICLAVSDDGLAWKKQGVLLVRDPERDYENIAVAGPVVQQTDDGGFRMWYSAIGTRWGAYSICYAESTDGIHWRRGPESGDNLQLAPQGAGWEQKMVEYPSVIVEGDHLRLFYCGNGYGSTGIGTAVSEPLTSKSSTSK